MYCRIQLSFLLFLLAVTTAAADVGGHGKLRLLANDLPSDSVLNTFAPSTPVDLAAEFRLDADASAGRWRFDIAWSAFVQHGDRVALSRDFSNVQPLYPDDESRLFDLTHVFSDSGKRLSLHRLDRLAISYRTDDLVIRAGRQVLSWGNGLFFSPMDLVNPFDPVAIDTEFKTGDDMLYAQRLFETGNDLQAAIVIRRDPLSGDVEESESSSLFKYHAFLGTTELDVLAGRHYREGVLGIGLSGSVGGAVVRGDVVVFDADRGATSQLVANVSYSWVAFGRNMTGSAEYFFNGFGQRAGRVSPTDFAGNPDLLRRLERGESFTVGRHYLAGSVGIEMTPLFTLTPTLLANADDRSALLQWVGQYSLADEIVLLGSINLPLGPSGTEFGGLPTAVPELNLSTGPGLFLQIAGYF